MLRNELFKYKMIKYTLSSLYMRSWHICALYICALLGTLSAPVAHANSPCADIIPPSSKEQHVSTFKGQSSPMSKEQGAPTHFGVSHESISHGRDILPLSSASIRDTFGFSSSSKTPEEQTKDFESYIGVLLEHQIIKEPQLIRFTESLEKGELINPISEEEAQVSTASLIQRRGLQQHLDKASLNQKELLDWARATLEKRARVQVKREEVQEETRELPYQKLEFHPVKRPIRFKMIYQDINEVTGKESVTLTYPIEVQSTPLTQKQWAEIMGENPSHFAKGKNSVVLTFHGKNIELQPDNPVENMTWWSALVFANRLSEQHGLPQAYDLSGIDWDPNTQPENGTLRPENWNQNKWMVKSEARIYVKGKSYDPHKGDLYYQTKGYRLPTLVEQMYMLQRGENPTDGSFFENKADLLDYAWYSSNSGGETHSVGLLQSMVIDGKDFYDLYGNVKEWGWDWTWNHPDGIKILLGLENPLGPMIGKNRTTRGGGWREPSKWINSLRLAHSLPPNEPFIDVGFRLVRTIKQVDDMQSDSD